MTANYEQIRDYLLGKLDSSESEAVDLRIIEDEEYAIESMAAEDALIEIYVDGELSDEDAERFRSNYLATEARADRVKQFAALRAVVSIGDRPRVVAPEEKQKERVGWFGPFRLVPAFAGLAVILMLGYVAWLYLYSGQTALEREYAALNQVDMNDLSQFGSLSTVELVPGTMRGSTAATKVVTGRLSGTVLFRLPLTFDPGADAQFDAALIKDGREVFAVPQIRPIRDSRGSEVRVLFPKQVINRGQYQLSLSRPNTQFAPVIYDFTAE